MNNTTKSVSLPLARANLYLLGSHIAASLTNGQWLVGYADPEDANREANRVARVRLMRLSDGVTLQINNSEGFSVKKDAIRVSNVPPRDTNGATPSVYVDGKKVETWVSINCAETKSAEQIARDIEKRLLPEAETIHAAVLVQIEKNRQSENMTENTIQRIAKATKGGRVSDNKVYLYPSDGKGSWDYNAKGYGHVEISGGGESVSFKLDCVPADKAIALAAWIRDNVFTD